jgi:hypothetical protein
MRRVVLTILISASVAIARADGLYSSATSSPAASRVESLPPVASPEVVLDPRWTQPAERVVVEPSTCLANRLAPPPQAWYTRLDFYYWDEVVESREFVNESGMLATLGYQRRWGPSRWRVEMFGGVMDYRGYAQNDDGLDPLHDPSGTTYLGCRGEYELLFEPPSFPGATFLAGMGTRLWVRSMDDMLVDSWYVCRGYQETWWTFYPYVGIETRESADPGMHFFGSARVGVTAWTYEHVSLDVTLHPRCGLTSAFELGFRGPRLSISAYAEAMTWAESHMHKDYYQPDSAMVTLGGRLLWRY